MGKGGEERGRGSFDLRENLRVKFSKIWLGDQAPRVQKFYEGVCDVDRGPRDLSNGKKNLALCLPYLEFN